MTFSYQIYILHMYTIPYKLNTLSLDMNARCEHFCFAIVKMLHLLQVLCTVHV